MFSWRVQLVCSQGMSAGVISGCNTRRVGGRKIREDFYDPLGMRLERKGKPKQVSCYRAENDELKVLDLKINRRGMGLPSS